MTHEDISNITRREIQILKYSFYYTMLLFHLLVNVTILKIREGCVRDGLGGPGREWGRRESAVREMLAGSSDLCE